MPYDIYDIETHKTKKVYHESELIEAIQNTLSFYHEQAKAARKTKEELREEVRQEYADRIGQLEKQLNFIPDYCHFSEKEIHDYKEFCKEHANCRKTFKINEGRIPYIIPTYTSIGIHSLVVCPICNKSKDITDYEAW